MIPPFITEVPGARRAALLAVVLLAMPLSAAHYAQRVDEVDLGVDECLDGGQRCVGRWVGWGFGRVAAIEGDHIVLSLRGGRRVRLVDWSDRPELHEGLVVSVGGTYAGDGALSVEIHQLHPLRRVKEVVGIVGLLGWLLGVGWFVAMRLGRDRWPTS